MSRLNKQVFSTSGSFTPQAGIKELIVYGRGNNSSTSQLSCFPLQVIPGTVYTITVGNTLNEIKHGSTIDVIFPNGSSSTEVTARNIISINASSNTGGMIKLSSNSNSGFIDVNITFSTSQTNSVIASEIVTALSGDNTFNANYTATRDGDTVIVLARSNETGTLTITYTDTANTGTLLSFVETDGLRLSPGEIILQWID